MQREKLAGLVTGFSKFCTVGGAVLVFNLAMLAIVSRFFGPSFSFLLVYVPSVALHFTLNKWWAFRCGRRDIGLQLLQYSAVAAMNFGVNFALYFVALHFVHSPILANLLAIPATTVIGYALFQRHVFQPSRNVPSYSDQDTRDELHAG